MLRIEREITSIFPEPIMMIGNFKIVNSTFTSFFILILFILFCYFVISRYKIRPNKHQSIVEILVESMIDFIKQITGSEKHAKVLFPLIASFFIYIGVANLIGLVPIIGSFKIGNVSLLRTPTADFNTTIGLAFSSIVLINIVSIKDWGLFPYLGKFLKFKAIYLGFRNGMKSGIMALIDFAIGLLDIIGEIAKVVSLSLRLFGNMYAGEILAVIILGSLAYVVPIAWTAMNLLSAVIQALVFGALITAYYMLAIKIKENEDI